QLRVCVLELQGLGQLRQAVALGQLEARDAEPAERRRRQQVGAARGQRGELGLCPFARVQRGAELDAAVPGCVRVGKLDREADTRRGVQVHQLADLDRACFRARVKLGPLQLDAFLAVALALVARTQ